MTTPSRPELDAWIDPAWGQYVHDRVMDFASLTEAKSLVPAPTDGQRGYLLNESSVIIGKGGTWRWLQKSFPSAAGNTSYLTWAAAVTAASSGSELSIAGRTVSLAVKGTMVTAATSHNAAVATLTSPYTPPVQLQFPAAGYHGTGAGSARTRLETSGVLLGTWATADNPTAVTNIIAQMTWSVADLIPAN